MGLRIVILAAGKGRRMVSSQPKVMHELGGFTLLEHVVTAATALNPDGLYVVYGNGGTQLPEQLHHLPVEWVYQKEQLGTGHALLQAIPNCNDNDQILVLYGDVPLISPQTLKQLLTQTPHHGVGLVVTELENPAGFGRIVRNELGNIISIVEDKDADEHQLKIREINTGILTASAQHLKNWLPKLSNDNTQKEYYLTDVVGFAVTEGVSVGGVLTHRAEEVLGINDRWQLAEVERLYQRKLAKQLAYQGVTVRDPARLDIRGHVKLEANVVLDVNVVLEGDVTIAAGAVIGPNAYIKDSVIGANTHVKANSVVEGARIASEVEIGPFARIRAGTVVEAHAKIGNFVEIKKSYIGAGSKASHLTYLGDAQVGKVVNIGAGTITCNYDGVEKHQTIIGDGAFIGSNTSLMAPLKVGNNAYIAAGSAVNKNCPADELTIVRAKQMVVPGWVSPKNKLKLKN